MDLGRQSPLVELFLQGPLPLDMRLLAASNQVSDEPAEQIALLAVLTGDADTQVVSRAWESWRALPTEVVAGVLAHAGTPALLRDWILANAHVAIAPAPDEPTPPTPELAAATDATPDAAASDEAASDDEELRQLSSLTVPERIKLAMLGSREQRALLVRDPNRVVSTAVLSSPKLSDTEVENFARMTNVTVDVLRIIGTNRSWMRNYSVVSALVRNPRTPPAISLPMVSRLQERDLKALSVDRNVPESLRLTSRKALVNKESRRS